MFISHQYLRHNFTEKMMIAILIAASWIWLIYEIRNPKAVHQYPEDFYL